MNIVPSENPYRSQAGAPRDDIPKFVPPLDSEEIFRRLIADELRSGRLTRAQRRRIVLYGASMGLSAVRIGRLVSTCREEALESGNRAERYHALRLVEPPPPLIPTHIKISLMVAAAIVIDVLLIFALCS